MRYFFLLFFTFLGFTINAQQTDVVNFITAKAHLRVNPLDKGIGGHVVYSFDVLKNTDSIYIDAVNFERIGVELDGKIIEHYYEGKHIVIKQKFKKGKSHNLTIGYYAHPKQTLYFIGWQDENENNQVWSQGQGKYTSHWLPSFDDVNEKVIFKIIFNVDEDYDVISNGKRSITNAGVGRKDHLFIMQKPMSSYLVALAIGKYDKTIITSRSGVPIELYYYPEDSAKVEPTYRYTKQMFDFLEEEIGVAYPWQNYKQVPVQDFLYSGMENTSCTIFSDDFMIDNTSFIDKNYVNVNAHELAHQWFGDFVTAISGEHHWLQEGFATYYALLAERDIFGEDYYYNTLYDYYQELVAQDDAGQSTALLNPKSSSTTFYKKGAWVLHMLREKVGVEAFKTAVKNYLKNHAYKNVETNDFISEVETTSGQDLTNFVDKWLASDILLENEMIAALETNETTSFLLTMTTNPYLRFRKDSTDNYIPSSLVTQFPEGYYPIQVAVLEEVFTKPDYPTFNDLIKEAFQSDNIKLRQALAANMAKIPSEFKSDYETLLDDASYVTKEIALFNLWANVPQQRNNYLEKTKSIYGFNNYNVRLLWLALAIATPDYQADKTQEFYDEIVDYTDSHHPFQRRQNAFSYLNELGLFNNIALENLVQASQHHNWRFKSFAKELLQSLSENENYKSIISNLQNNQKE
ncbi:M1 family metallopeptidase [Olleya sp. YS]|uniref:M1 family metallopeptidase n=1 Tax=Olleya sp. YS TaxID=3028318 RepID=UPI0024343F58|nr:M1 family metallopeptidase [Olleya sp. YS]WGD34203.1 M1 family metallopeptidase [Olleya sp. YS]